MAQALLVLLPGLLCDETVWLAQQQALSLSLSLSLSQSQSQVQVQCRIPSYGTLSSITAMANQVLADTPAERFSLAGHSMGGRVALEMLRLAPQRIERLALLDTGLDPLAPGDAGMQERKQRFELLETARRQGMRAMGQQWARGMVHPARLDTPLFEAVLQMIERKTPAVFEAQIQALLGRPDAREVWSAARCPTLLVCGRQDAWSPLARHEQMQALLPAARLVVIEDAGHMAPMEQPAAVSAALAGWLEDR